MASTLPARKGAWVTPRSIPSTTGVRAWQEEKVGVATGTQQGPASPSEHLNTRSRRWKGLGAAVGLSRRSRVKEPPLTLPPSGLFLQ